MYPIKEINAARKYMIEQGKTIAIAESVTSGHLQAAFSLSDNAALFFQGGLTAYNIGQKARHLHIDPIHAAACDCVSQIVADQMAIAITKQFSADYGIAVTGYAAKVPEKGIEELFAYYSISLDEKIIRSGKILADPQEALQVQLYFTQKIIEYFNELICSK